MLKIINIIDIDQLVISMKLNNGEDISVSFDDLLKKWSVARNSILGQLYDQETFAKAKTNGFAVYWNDLAKMETADGNIIPAPIDFDVDTLYMYKDVN